MLFFDGMGAWWRVEAWWWIRLNAPEVLDSEVGFHPVGENIIHQNWDGGAPFTQPWKPYIYMYESNIWHIYIYTIQGMMGPGYFGWPPPHHRCHWPTLAETTFVPKRNRQKSRKSMETGVFLGGLFWEISLPKFGVRGRVNIGGPFLWK